MEVEVSEEVVTLSTLTGMDSNSTLDNIPMEIDTEGEESDDDENLSFTEDTGSEEEINLEENTYLNVGSALDALGYQWGPNSKNWTFWTIWEPSILENLKQFSRMKKDHFVAMKDEEFFSIINQSFFSICSDRSFIKIEPKEMPFMVFRLDFDPRIERYSPRSKIVEIKGTGLFFNNINRAVSLRFRQTSIIACTGLAEILRATCSPNDLLIFAGSYKRVCAENGHCFLLTNYHNNNSETFKLQIVRLSFKAMEEIRMIEKIKPTRIDNRFEFKYFARSPCGKNSREVSIHQNFNLLGTSENFHQYAKRPIPNDDFQVPIRHTYNVTEIYIFLLSTKPPSPKSPTHFIKYSTPTLLEDLGEYDDDNESEVVTPEELHMDENDEMQVFSAKWESYPVSKTPVHRNKGSFAGYHCKDENTPSCEHQPPRGRRRSDTISSHPMPQANAIQPWKKFVCEIFSNILVLLSAVFWLAFIYVGTLLFLDILIDPHHYNSRQTRIFSLDLVNDSSVIINEYGNSVISDRDTIIAKLENVLASIVDNVQNMITSFIIWLGRNWRFEFLLRRLGYIETISHGPIV